ncbi:MAG: hypothetical protein HQM09_03090 [Candidatus Riflebacteria bacterium]|nr:hypothetical protein [Candidatus Riflebacteria bacterium]
MKKSPIDTDFPPDFKKKFDIDLLTGLPSQAKSPQSLAESVANKLASKPPSGPIADIYPANDHFWKTQKLFTELFERHGKPFARFIGDLLDIMMSGPLQDKLVSELIDEKISHQKRMDIERKPFAEQETSSGPDRKVPPPKPSEKDIKIGGEPRVRMRHFLKRKKLFSSLFLDSKEYTGFSKIMKSLAMICEEETDPSIRCGTDHESRHNSLVQLVERLKREITRPDLLAAWALLEADSFTDLEWVFLETCNLGLILPTYYEDLDKAYREAKKLLKLLIKDFESEFPPSPDKKSGILDYLQEVQEVYMHHHFVVKSMNYTRPISSRQEIEARERELQVRIDKLRSENERMREENKRLSLDRESAIGMTSALRRETDELRASLLKLDPVEVSRQIKGLESKMNAQQKEYDTIIEEDTELRTALRQMDVENQNLLRQLRDLNAIPNETAKSVENLMLGKRVVIFGGVGRDHYLPLMKEAGVKDADYEWYEGYRTISQNRTAEIVRRCDLVVVITSYAGHLHTWQTRDTVTDQQTLVYIHNSGTGTLRQAIIEKFRKDETTS